MVRPAPSKITKLAGRAKQTKVGMSFLESASYWTGNFAVGLTAAAAIAGIFAWIFSSRLATEKDTALKRFQEESRVAIASADARAAEANQRAAEANKIAEEERLARVKLEARLAPRSLSAESRQKISASLKQFAPQVFNVVAYSDDPDSQNLAVQILETVRDAGWTPNQTGEFLIGLQIGVFIDFAPSKMDDFGPAAVALASKLQKEGITAMARSNPEKERRADRIAIDVGKKP
jgi:hypothetical protein